MLPKINKFTKEDFSIVFNSCNTKRESSHFFTLLSLKDESLLMPKLGVILAKKKQKRAVDRNYTKRIIQAFFYKHKREFDSLRLLVISKNEIKNADRASLWKDIEKLFAKLNY